MWKFLFFLGWILIAVSSLFCIYIGISPDYLDNINFFDMNTRGIIIGVSLFFFILFIRKTVSIFEHGEYRITIENTVTGEIGITVSSIEEIVKCVLRERKWINDYKISSKIKHKNLFIKGKISVETNKDIREDLKVLQEDIINRVSVLTGIKITELNLLVSDIRYETDKNEKY